MHNLFIEGIQGSGKSTLVNALAKALPGYQVYREGDLSPVELAWCSYLTPSQFAAVLAAYPDLREELFKWSLAQDDRGHLIPIPNQLPSAPDKLLLSQHAGTHYITAYTRILAERRAFYEHMESFEIYNGRVPFSRFREIILQRYAAFSGEGNVFECSFFQNSIESMMLYYEMKEDEMMAFYADAFELLCQKHFVMLYLKSEDIWENIAQLRRERVDDQGAEMWFPLMMEYLKTSPYGQAHNYQDMDDLISHLERRQTIERRVIDEILGAQAILLPAKDFVVEDVLTLLRRRT